MDDQASADLSRRKVLQSAAIGVVSAPILAACGGGDEDPAGASSGSSSGPTATSSAKRSGGTQNVLAQTGDVKVGGGLFLDEPPVVITQPEAGDFHAFDRTCTHEQCLVTQITDGLILCTCHNSVYDMSTGENVGGPAPAPLSKVDIAVKGGQITEA